jgi:hypothetical protein
MRRLDWLMTILGLASLGTVFAVPNLLSSSTRGDDLVRLTVRLSLIYYALALTIMLLLRPAGWSAATMGGRLARWSWTWAWLIYVVHVACAFHFYHHWSHADAIRHTAEVSGFGPGIFASHFFTLAWGFDVGAWWLTPSWYASRPVWIDRALHAFMLFIVFNGTVVYETGPIRWAGVLLFIELVAVYLYRRYKLRYELAPEMA